MFWVLFRYTVFFGLIFLLFFVICMGLYDIKLARRNRKKSLSRSQSAIQYSNLQNQHKESRKRLSVTVIIPAYNEELVIKRCLDSVAKLDYPNFQAVVVSDASKDRTAKIVREYIKLHPGLKLRLVNLRKNRGKGGAINYVLKHYCDTDLVNVLDADCTIASDALTQATRYFADDNMMGLAANVKVAEDPTILSYLQKIEYIVGYRHKKFASLLNSEFIIGGQGATYRTSIVKQVKGFDETMMTEDIALSLSVARLGNKTHRLAYASDVITYTEAVPDISGLFKQRYRWKFGGLQALAKNRELIFSKSKKHSRLLTWLRIPQAIWGEILLLVEPLLLLAFLVIAFSTRSLLVFFGTWFTLSVYTICIVLIDEHTKWKETLKLCLMVPLMYPFFYMITLLNVVAAFKCIWNWRQMLGLDNVKGTWVSPTRVGKASLN